MHGVDVDPADAGHVLDGAVLSVGVLPDRGPLPRPRDHRRPEVVAVAGDPQQAAEPLGEVERRVDDRLAAQALAADLLVDRAHPHAGPLGELREGEVPDVLEVEHRDHVTGTEVGVRQEEAGLRGGVAALGTGEVVGAHGEAGRPGLLHAGPVRLVLDRRALGGLDVHPAQPRALGGSEVEPARLVVADVDAVEGAVGRERAPERGHRRRGLRAGEGRGRRGHLRRVGEHRDRVRPGEVVRASALEAVTSGPVRHDLGRRARVEPAVVDQHGVDVGAPQSRSGRAVPRGETDLAEHRDLAPPVPREQVDDATAVVGPAGGPDPAVVVGALHDREPVAQTALGLLQGGARLPVHLLRVRVPELREREGLVDRTAERAVGTCRQAVGGERAGGVRLRCERHDLLAPLALLLRAVLRRARPVRGDDDGVGCRVGRGADAGQGERHLPGGVVAVAPQRRPSFAPAERRTTSLGPGRGRAVDEPEQVDRGEVDAEGHPATGGERLELGAEGAQLPVVVAPADHRGSGGHEVRDEPVVLAHALVPLRLARCRVRLRRAVERTRHEVQVHRVQLDEQLAVAQVHVGEVARLVHLGDAGVQLQRPLVEHVEGVAAHRDGGVVGPRAEEDVPLGSGELLEHDPAVARVDLLHQHQVAVGGVGPEVLARLLQAHRGAGEGLHVGREHAHRPHRRRWWTRRVASRARQWHRWCRCRGQQPVRGQDRGLLRHVSPRRPAPGSEWPRRDAIRRRSSCARRG